jgi:hypothetical protein
MLPARPAPRLEQPQRLEGVSQQGDNEILHPKDNAHPAGAPSCQRRSKEHHRVRAARVAYGFHVRILAPMATPFDKSSAQPGVRSPISDSELESVSIWSRASALREPLPPLGASRPRRASTIPRCSYNSYTRRRIFSSASFEGLGFCGSGPRDFDFSRYNGKGCLNAVANVTDVVAPRFLGQKISALGSVADIDRELLSSS